jgi:hypothetical protein
MWARERKQESAFRRATKQARRSPVSRLSTPLPISLSHSLSDTPLPSLLSSPLRRRLHSHTAATAYVLTNPDFSLQIQQQQQDAFTRLCLGSLLHCCICLFFFCRGRKVTGLDERGGIRARKVRVNVLGALTVLTAVPILMRNCACYFASCE